MSQPSLASFIVKRPWLRGWMQPLSNWYTDVRQIELHPSSARTADPSRIAALRIPQARTEVHLPPTPVNGPSLALHALLK